MVRKGGLEPPPLTGPDPKSGASANSATLAGDKIIACLPTNRNEAAKGYSVELVSLEKVGNCGPVNCTLIRYCPVVIGTILTTEPWVRNGVGGLRAPERRMISSSSSD